MAAWKLVFLDSARDTRCSVVSLIAHTGSPYVLVVVYDHGHGHGHGPVALFTCCSFL